MNAGRCPVCGGDSAQELLTIEDVPVFCNVLWSDATEARACPRADIRLVMCDRCEMVWNCAFEPEAARYSQAYESSLHFSPTFQAYLHDLAKRLVEGYGVKDKEVLEIGCGDGRFLSLICELGSNHGLGFDPGHRPVADPGYRVVAAEYSSDLVERPVDLICGRHVLEHVPRPRSLLAEVRAGMADGGLAYFEVPDFRAVLEGSSTWDVLYEHCLYFTAGPLRLLFQESGFRIEELSSAYGDEFLCLVARPAQGRADRSRPGRTGAVPPPPGRPAPIRALAESLAALHRDQVSRWADRLARWHAEGTEAVVWGAGSRGVMFLNSVPGARDLRWVVDVNPRKRRAFVSGTGQEIFAPEDVPPDRPGVVLVMNPIYQTEVGRMMSGLGWDAELAVA